MSGNVKKCLEMLEMFWEYEKMLGKYLVALFVVQAMLGKVR